MGYVTARRSLLKALFGSTCAAALILGQQPLGLALDFVNQSILIRDNTLANRFASTGILDSAGNLIGPGAKLTYTSPSPKLCLQSNGFYQYGAHNTQTFSTTLTNGIWTQSRATVALTTATTAPDGTSTAYALTEDVTAALDHRLVGSPAAFPNHVPGQWSCYAKANTRTFVALRLNTNNNASTPYVWFNLTTGTVGVTNAGITNATCTSAGNGWYLCSAQWSDVFSSPGPLISIAPSDGVVNYNGDGTSGIYIWGPKYGYAPMSTAYVATGAASVFTLPYEYNTSAVCQGILVEEARTNSQLYSNTFSDAGWTKTRASISGTTTGPDGVSTSGQALIEDSSTNTHLMNRTVSGLASNTQTGSIFAKANGRTKFRLNFSDNSTGNATALFDLSAVTVGTFVNGGSWTGTTGTITSVGNGWYRCTMTSTRGAGTDTVCQIDLCNSGGSTSYAGDGASGLYVYNYQLEVGAFATSPIITGSATVTRAADAITIAASLTPTNTNAAHSWYIKCFGLAPASINKEVLANDASNEFMLITAGDTYRAIGGGFDLLGAGAGAYTPLTTKKLGLGVASGDGALYENATQVAVSAGPTLANATTTYTFGRQGNGTGYWNGYIQQAMIVPTRLSNTQLQTLTT